MHLWSNVRGVVYRKRFRHEIDSLKTSRIERIGNNLIIIASFDLGSERPDTVEWPTMDHFIFSESNLFNWILVLRVLCSLHTEDKIKK